MRSLRPSFLWVMALVLALGAISAACGDGGATLTLEQFFERLQEIDDDFEARSSDLETEFANLGEEEFLQQAPPLLRRQAELLGEFVDGLSALDPPEEAADLHDEAVAAGREAEELFRQQIDEAEAADSIEALFTAFESEELTSAFDRFDQACLDAEQLAADNGITVDFSCAEE